MKRLIAVAAMVLSTTAVAQPDKDWWACQVVHSSGMYWENNRWATTSFTEDSSFVLMSDGNELLTKESAAKAMGSLGQFTECRKLYTSQITCTEGNGVSLYFDPDTSRGGRSTIFGATDADTNSRDTVSVDAFECTKG
jgi:hypothetical protein